MKYTQLHENHKELRLYGRYITLEHIEPLLENFQTKIIGKSVLNQPIHLIEIGKGRTRILIWSQMHGNESTTTKAIFDFLNFLTKKCSESEQILEKYTFCILPMLNPDGAKAYTRENANGVDLNRDAQNLSQPESIVLRTVFDDFKPDYCYNLHDQRTIFGTGTTGKPATISFLAPAYNEKREINSTRTKAIDLIVKMNDVLQQYIPNQVGRFDDTFNINCVGDTFQYFNVPTILFEAGHFVDDYDREISRKYIFIALLSSISCHDKTEVMFNKIDEYLKIPQNEACFFDFIYENVKINFDDKEKSINFAAQYKEVLLNGKISFEAHLVSLEGKEKYFGHCTLNAKDELFFDGKNYFPNYESKANFFLGKSIKIVNGLKI